MTWMRLLSSFSKATCLVFIDVKAHLCGKNLWFVLKLTSLHSTRLHELGKSVNWWSWSWGSRQEKQSDFSLNMKTILILLINMLWIRAACYWSAPVDGLLVCLAVFLRCRRYPCFVCAAGRGALCLRTTSVVVELLTDQFGSIELAFSLMIFLALWLCTQKLTTFVEVIEVLLLLMNATFPYKWIHFVALSLNSRVRPVVVVITSFTLASKAAEDYERTSWICLTSLWNTNR